MELLLSSTHTLKGDGYFLGLSGENASDSLIITVQDERLHDKWAYIEFKNNDEEKWSTPRLEMVNGVINYPIVNGLLKEGQVEVQVVFRDGNRVVWKSFPRKFVVGESLCVSDQLPIENPEFITEAQKLLDEVSENYEKSNQISQEALSIANESKAYSESVAAGEVVRVANEEIRISNELTRDEAESSRETNEAVREVSEEVRVENEQIRISNENIRKEAELVRTNAEVERQVHYEHSKTAETQRVEAENARINAENARISAESARSSAENTRISSETSRMSNEEARITSEKTRISNESVRQSNESTREANEATRQENERLRVKAENSRSSEIESLNKLLENMYIANEGKTYNNVIDNSIAYRKANPTNVLPYAKVNNIGGMSYKVDETFQHAVVTNLRSVGKNKLSYPYFETTKTEYGVTFTDNGDGTITLNGTATAGAYFNFIKEADIKFNKPITISLFGDTDNVELAIIVDGELRAGIKTITLDSGTLNTVAIAVMSGAVSNQIVYVMIEENDTATDYEPYIEHNLSIPSEVQALDGYGLGLDVTYYNYVDLKNKKFVQMVGVSNSLNSYIISLYRDIEDEITIAFKINQVANNNWYLKSSSCDKFTQIYSIVIDFEGYSHGDNTSDVYIRINKSKLEGYSFDLTNEEKITLFKNWLSENNTYFIYCLETPIETDILTYMNDYLIEVEENGSITFENEHTQDVPSEITYQVKL